MIQIRLATSDDADTISQMILDLAEFQKHADEVKASPSALRQQLSQELPPFECLIAEMDGSPAGFALFYDFYSTWEGSPGIYLEDLFVYPDARGKGIGKLLLSRLTDIATSRGCTRLDWMVQNSNSSAQNFYANFGARSLPDWTRWRFDVPAPMPQTI